MRAAYRNTGFVFMPGGFLEFILIVVRGDVEINLLVSRLIYALIKIQITSHQILNYFICISPCITL
jgi:hypothetical protein